MLTPHLGPRTTFGVVGGMGPLASAAFVQTVYEQALTAREQDMPDVVLISKPSIPDRSSSLLAGDTTRFEEALHALLVSAAREADRIVICCFTSHYVLPLLAPALRQQLISLVGVLADELRHFTGRALLLATAGSYHAQVFAGLPLAPGGELLVPDKADQSLVHELIYGILKPGKSPAAVLPAVEQLLAKYQADCFVAGCTEFHLLTRYIQANTLDITYIDPLMTLARHLPAYLAA